MNEQEKIDKLMTDVACLLTNVENIKTSLDNFTLVPQRVSILEKSVGLLNRICWTIGSTVIGIIVVAIIGLIIV